LLTKKLPRTKIKVKTHTLKQLQPAGHTQFQSAGISDFMVEIFLEC